MTYVPYESRDITTTEHATERMLEGKLVYRKLVTHSGNLTANATTTVAHGISGHTKVVNIYGSVNCDGGQKFPLQMKGLTTGSTFQIQAHCDATNLNVSIGAGWTGAGNVLSDIWAVIEYVK